MRARARLAALLVAAVTLAAHAQSPLPTVQGIVEKNITAKGGLDRLKAVRARRVTAKVVIGSGLQMDMTITTERPNRLRQDVTVQGQAIVVAFDGETAWTINPLLGTSPQILPAPELERLKLDADMDGPLVDAAAKGTTVEFAGAAKVGGAQTHRLKLTRKDGQLQELFLDPVTGLEVKAINHVDQNGQKRIVETYFSDYRTVDGLTLAHTIKQRMEQQATVTITKVELLPDVDDSLFRLPRQ
jgi:outer membrane lipoprotein-sorting protein